MRPQFGLPALMLRNLILYNTELPKLLLEQCHQPNEKAEQECGLPPLESRRSDIKLLINYAHMPLIPKKTHQRIPVSNWNCCSHVPKRRPCIDKKGLETNSLKITFAIAYTDGSSDRSLSNGDEDATRMTISSQEKQRNELQPLYRRANMIKRQDFQTKRSERSNLTDDDNAVNKTYESYIMEGEISSYKSDEETHGHI
ncbi:hypothetical protein TNCV_3061131 [Trichonephila clavipes]|nr:hypothetical protein TNCV_3061131 [Trichonephila clavipes]